MVDPAYKLAGLLRRAAGLPRFVGEVIRSGNWHVAANGAREILRREGWRGVHRRLLELVDDRHQYLFPDYPGWVAREERCLQSAGDVYIPAVPALISVLLPTYNPDPQHLQEAIESVRQQSFPRWELCIADDHSTDPRIAMLLTEYAAKDARIRICLRESNGHISAASNSALALAAGDYIALLDHDDILPRDALLAVANEIAAFPGVAIVFSDEDKITPGGQRFGPVFKPDWDPDLMLQRNFVSHLGVFNTTAVRAAGGFRQGFEGSQDWDLTLRVATSCGAEGIRHIPRILYHWRAIPGSTALHLNEKNYAVGAGLRAVEDHIRQLHLPLQCVPSLLDPFWNVRAQPRTTPRVSVIVGPEISGTDLTIAVDRLRRLTDYPDCEFLLATGSRDAPAAETYGPSLAAATGEVLCFLSPSLEPRTRDWLDDLVVHAQRPDVGAVGARLLDRDMRIAHAGYRLDPDEIVQPLYAGAPERHRGYMDRARLIQSLAAIGGGCLVISRETFLRAGGFSHPVLSGVLADVDLCLRLAASGLRNVWLPQVTLQMQFDAAPQLDPGQIPVMRQLWGHRLAIDAAFNPNLALDDNHPCLRYAAGGRGTRHG